jgi:cation:H+ antiporter
MLLNFLAVVAGFAILIGGADRFVIGASATARNLGVPPLIIGLTVVGFGTSAPEMLVSGLAAWYGNPGISVGNALGSNIANIGLVIGATALVAPISVHSKTLRREFPLLFIFMTLALLLLLDGYLSLLDGVLLITGMFFMLYWITRIALRSRVSDPMQEEFAEEIPLHMPMWKAGLWLLVGLVLLLLGSRLVVYGATEIARWLGVSDLVIGLTVIAIGTSLPELAASIMCVLKNEDDIAVGNVVGSNMFNLLGVMGIPGLIMPFQVPAEALSRDFVLMFVLTIALFGMSFGFGGNHGRITRPKGAALLASFLAYMFYLSVISV